MAYYINHVEKIPTDPATGNHIDHLNPANALTFDQAASTGMGVGMVFCSSDPYFFLDLDNCLVDGAWLPGVEIIVSMFPNAAVEVSMGGKGLHILGRCSKLFDRSHKFKAHGIDCEFYFDNRYMALGKGFKGDSEMDWTAELELFVPIKQASGSVITGSGPVDEWTGPVADDVLVERMLNEKPSASVLFSSGASAKDLWDKNIPALRAAYPKADGTFDWSSADVALMSKLAFWSGKDAERMERIFSLSALADRKKWKKTAGYRTRTVEFAISKCENVYDIPIEFEELMGIGDQEKYFEGCVYVIDDHSVMIPDGTLLKPDRFRAVYGGHSFAMSKTQGRACYNAFEVFTESRAVNFPKVRRTRFLPGKAPGEIVGDGVNVYRKPKIKITEGDVEPFLGLMRKMLPNYDDQEILLSWMASLLQNPGKKFLWSPVLQGTKGNGKGFIGECLINAIGEEYCWSVKPQKIDAQFNTFLQNRIFINVAEMNMFRKQLDVLKDYITETRQEIEGKGSNSVMISDYCANWLFCTNNKDGVIKERDDRRFTIFFTHQQSRADMERDGMLDSYFPDLWDWARGGGFAHVAHYLLNYSIQHSLDPAKGAQMAPDSSSTEEAIAISRDPLEQFIVEAVETEQTGFKGGWISTGMVAELFKTKGYHRAFPPARIGSILRAMGYEKDGQSTRTIIHEINSRPTLWKLRHVKSQYEIAQGYTRANMSLVAISERVKPRS